MAGLEADTSSYNMPMPVSPLKQVHDIGAVQQQKLQIDQAKMEQANQALSYMSRAMGSIGPNAPKEEYAKVAQTAVDMGLVPQQQLNVFMTRLQSAKDSPSFYREFMSMAADQAGAIAMHTGAPAAANDGATEYQGKRDLISGGFTPATQIATQPPPTQSTVDSRRRLPNGEPNPTYGEQGIIGARAAPGVRPAAGMAPAPIAAPANPQAPAPRPQAALPVAAPGGAPKPTVSGPSGPTVQTGHNFDERFAAAFPNKVVTGLAPGAAGAVATAATAGANSLVKARDAASKYQREIFPLQQAIPALEKLGTKGTGPGTETIQHIKSFVLSNIPGVKESDFNGTVADYDKAKKYLTDFVNQTGNSGTNDKLAAAFAGNPSVGISNAAAVDVAKAALALRRMQQAELAAFEKSGLPEEQFQQFSVRFNNEQDPRAYGFDQMDQAKRKKLIENMSPEELVIFKKSLEFAHTSKILPPIGKR